MKRLMLAMLAFGWLGFAVARAATPSPVTPPPATPESLQNCSIGACIPVAQCRTNHGTVHGACGVGGFGVCCLF